LPQTLDRHDDRDDDDDDSVDEDPLESDQDPDDDDAGESIPCPFCKKPIHEDADVCPRCGNFVGGDDAPRRRVPLFVWIGMILAGLCVLTWVLL
jgi:predicted nucleic acid-binding Zn ribbon protein